MTTQQTEQKAKNQAEWENPANWSGPNWLALYFSKRDTRVWVPKRIPSMGWTINLGTTAGVFWLFGVMLVTPLILVAVILLQAAGVK